MMNMNNEAADIWPSGIAMQGFNFSNNVVANDPLLIGNTFEVPNPGGKQVRNSTNSHHTSIGVSEAINNSNGNYIFGFEETNGVSNLPSSEVRESINNNDGSFVEIGITQPALPQTDLLPSLAPGGKPFVGMEFDTIDASHAFWERYAHDTGFRARIRATSRRKRDGVIRSRTYVCAKEGTKGVDRRRTYAKRRPETRCGCGATMLVSLVKETGHYRVVTFVEEHNHGLDGTRNTPLVTVAVDPTHVEGRPSNKPVVGMEFDTTEASGAFWEQYAHDVGFGARIRSTSKRKNDGVVRTRTYVCSREGTKFVDPRNLNSKPRSDTRCGCGVLMTVSLVKEKGTYRVVTFVEEHNHELDRRGSIPRLKVPAQRVRESKKRAIDVAQGSISNNVGSSSARTTFVQNSIGPTVPEGPLLNLTNAQRMGILCTEFMQLAYRAVGSNEVFEGVRGLIRDGHSIADKY